MGAFDPLVAAPVQTGVKSHFSKQKKNLFKSTLLPYFSAWIKSHSVNVHLTLNYCICHIT